MSAILKKENSSGRSEYADELLRVAEQRVNFAYMLFMAIFILANIIYIIVNDWDDSRFLFAGLPCGFMAAGVVINAVFYKKCYRWIKYVNTLIMLLSIIFLEEVSDQITLLLVLIPFFNSFYFKPWFTALTGIVSLLLLALSITSILTPLYNDDGSLNTNLFQVFDAMFAYSGDYSDMMFRNRSFLLIIAGALTVFAVVVSVNVKKSTIRQGELTEQTLSAKSELNLARNIQMGILSTDFPDNESFAISADMTAAKEVGGDFYDYFMLDDSRLAIVVGDVSGHGIAAAMFMTLSKTLIKVYARDRRSTDKVLEQTNRYLLSSNPAKLFVTCWIGILDLCSGVLTYSNAGHNYPVIIRGGEKPEFLKSKPNFVLGRRRLVSYNEKRTRLCPGDKLVLYTDGVTEAQSPEGDFFSDERLLKAIDSVKNKNQDEIVSALRRSIDDFENGGDHYDDATILALCYKKKLELAQPDSKTFFLDKSTFDSVTDYIASKCTEAGCNEDVVGQIVIATSEILANIDSYAYENGGDIEVLTKCRDRRMTVIFKDSGRPFNPMLVQEPDVSLALGKRKPGGLGIFIVKKLMSDVSYVYDSGQNVLTVDKDF